MERFDVIKDICVELGLTQIENSWIKTLGGYLGVPAAAGDDYERRVFVELYRSNLSPTSGSVLIFDTFTDFPAIGEDDTLYVTEDSNIIYRYDSTLSTYVLLNDPDNVNPDAPEEGQSFFAKLATTSRLNPVSVYNNGTGGVGATLTGSTNGALGELNYTAKIDNTTPVLGDVVLIKNEVSGLKNGLYEITQLGNAGAPYILTRIDGYNETAEVYPSVTFISGGQNNINRYFNQTTVNPVIGTNNLTYAVAATSQALMAVLFIDVAIPLGLVGYTYTSGTVYNGLPGYGATITSNSNGAFGTVEGLPITSGMRVLLTSMSNPAHNGDYTVTNAGSATQPWRLTRIGYSFSTMGRTAREWVVSNPNSANYGSRFSLTNNSFLNNQVGSVGLVFEKTNTLGNTIAGTTYNSNVMLDDQNIVSEDGFGELKMGYDYTQGFESYLYRATDGNGEGRVGLYTDTKGITVWDSTVQPLNDKLDIFTNRGKIDIHSIDSSLFGPEVLIYADNTTTASKLKLTNDFAQLANDTETNYIQIDSGSNEIQINVDNANITISSSETHINSDNGDLRLTGPDLFANILGGNSQLDMRYNGNFTRLKDVSFLTLEANNNTDYSRITNSATGGMTLECTTGSININTLSFGMYLDMDVNLTRTKLFSSALVEINTPNNVISITESTDIISLVAGNNVVINSGNAVQITFGLIQLVGLQTFADNAAAQAGGIPVNYLYKTATGQVMIRY